MKKTQHVTLLGKVPQTIPLYQKGLGYETGKPDFHDN